MISSGKRKRKEKKKEKERKHGKFGSLFFKATQLIP
jgi:hypothetical protein